ncbi:MAG: APC family permease [Flectobacillus sp.]|uniref:APC family permease n=1 Tax=Flectobacillus sp. TaxID=50419 RepID=UPI003B9A8980
MSSLQPKIGLSSASLLVVSVIVGSGVFKKIAPMSAELGSPWLVLLCWIFAGLITLAGALTTAEMASLFPDSGGEYQYYKKVYNSFFAFLYGWGNFTVMKTASIAALAFVFAESFYSLFSVNFQTFGLDAVIVIKTLASLLVIGLSYINHRGLIIAEKLSNLLTFLMLLAVMIFVIWGIFSSKGSWENISHTSFQGHHQVSYQNWIKMIFTASLGAFWGYEGWNHIGFIGEEVKSPQRNLPLALMFGTLIVIVLYVSLNLVYLKILPIEMFIEMNGNPNAIAAIEVARVLIGSWGTALFACLILLTTFNATNGTILMSARLFYAMGRDGLFFKKTALIHSKYQTPTYALLFQGCWSILLIWSGSFDQLTDMLVFAAFIYYGATALGVVILRKKEPNLSRTYRVIGYPFIPIFFILFCIILVIVTLFAQPAQALAGLVLIGSGIPLYFYWRKNHSD